MNEWKNASVQVAAMHDQDIFNNNYSQSYWARMAQCPGEWQNGNSGEHRRRGEKEKEKERKRKEGQELTVNRVCTIISNKHK